jgi:hypothetical protein
MACKKNNAFDYTRMILQETIFLLNAQPYDHGKFAKGARHGNSTATYYGGVSW